MFVVVVVGVVPAMVVLVAALIIDVAPVVVWEGEPDEAVLGKGDVVVDAAVEDANPELIFIEEGGEVDGAGGTIFVVVVLIPPLVVVPVSWDVAEADGMLVAEMAVAVVPLEVDAVGTPLGAS